MKKNGFLVFIFSLIPGAGHMYLNMMRKGVMLMSAFIAVMFLAFLLKMEIILLILPIIWFYSFFDAMNMRHKSEEERIADDRASVILIRDGFFGSVVGRYLGGIFAKRHIIMGVVLIAFGLYIGADKVTSRLYAVLPDYLYRAIRAVFSDMPTIVVAVLIIILGVKLCSAPKPKDDIIEYKGGGDKNE